MRPACEASPRNVPASSPGCRAIARVNPDDAAGALLLFITNFAAIVVAACIVFTLTGAAPSREMIRERNLVRNGFVAAVIALVIIAIPLVWQTGIESARGWIRATAGAPYVREWVGDRDLQVREWSVEGETVHAARRPGRTRRPTRRRSPPTSRPRTAGPSRWRSSTSPRSAKRVQATP